MSRMMDGLVLKAQKNGMATWLDLRNQISDFDVSRELAYDVDYTTIDGEIVRMGKRERTVVRFTLLPRTSAELLAAYTVLRGIDGLITLYYSDPFLNAPATGHFWLDSNPLQKGLVKCAGDTAARYSLGEFVYRAKNAETYV